MSPPPDDLRATLDKLSVVIEYFKRDLDETRRQVREEFVTMREYRQLQTAFEDLKRSMADTMKAMADRTVTKEEFTPVKSIVFGVVAVILTTVIGALLVLVVRRG